MEEGGSEGGSEGSFRGVGGIHFKRKEDDTSRLSNRRQMEASVTCARHRNRLETDHLPPRPLLLP